MVIAEVPLANSLPVDLIHQSKITAPPAWGTPRPRLVELIDRGVRGKLTVVSAPAGWGKSTLLAEWAAQTTMNVAWVSLDERDNEPGQYFRLLAAALDRIYPLRLDDVFAMLRSPTPAIDDQIDGAIMSRIVELPDETVLVLDDFHAMTRPEFLRSFGHVLDHLPPTFHIAIATRGELQFPLARLRSAGDVTMLGTRELAFTASEAASVLDGRNGPELDARDIALLVDRTEGWIAGLRLATLSLGGDRDMHAAIERFSGVHRDIADYFREEVLDRVDPDLRQFLIETSILDSFTESLVNAVTSRVDADRFLSRTSAADLFLIPLDHDRAWYRYHRLFRDILLADFARLPAQRQDALHGLASKWYERSMMVKEAVEHALAGNDPERTAALVDRYADILMYACGETNLLVNWIESLPETCLDERPGLLRVYAWGLTTLGRIDHAERLADRMCDALLQSGGPGAQPHGRARDAQLAAIQARIAAYRGDHRATIVHGRRALDALDPIQDGRMYGDVVLSIGLAERALGNMAAATDAFGEAARLGRLHGNVQAARWGVRYLAVTRFSQGRLHEAEAIIDEDLERVRQDASDPGGMLSALLVGKAEILIERNRLAEARPLLEQAILLVQRVGDAKMLHNAYIAMGTLLHAENRPVEAREKMRRAEEIFCSANRGARVAWLALVQGNIAEAQLWARYSGFSVDDDADPNRGAYEQVIFARVASLTEPSPGSFGLLERLIEDAEAGGRHGRAVELLNILAVASARAGNSARGRQALGRSLFLARNEGFIRVFLNEGPEMMTLLRNLVRERTALDDASRVHAMEVLAQGSRDPLIPSGPSALTEPLTSRQLEILHLLAAGQSNRDIAGHLFIAEGTVKAHMHQLFGKLMARNRTEAVANARELRLLA